MKYLAPALLLLVLSIGSLRADINENDPFALGVIKKQPRSSATPLPMEPVKPADFTEDYEKDFSHFKQISFRFRGMDSGFSFKHQNAD